MRNILFFAAMSAALLASTAADAKGARMSHTASPPPTPAQVQEAKWIQRLVSRCIERTEKTKSALWHHPGDAYGRSYQYDELRNICIAIVANKGR